MKLPYRGQHDEELGPNRESFSLSLDVLLDQVYLFATRSVPNKVASSSTSMDEVRSQTKIDFPRRPSKTMLFPVPSPIFPVLGIRTSQHICFSHLQPRC